MVVLCYIEGNEAAKQLYLKLGFYHTGEAEEDEIVMGKRLRQKSCYATVYSLLALPLGELSPQVTERALQPF